MIHEAIILFSRNARVLANNMYDELSFVAYTMLSVAHPSRPRTKLLELTDTGRACLARVRQHQRKGLQERLGRWPDEDVETFSRLLWRFVTELDRRAGPARDTARGAGEDEHSAVTTEMTDGDPYATRHAHPPVRPGQRSGRDCTGAGAAVSTVLYAEHLRPGAGFALGSAKISKEEILDFGRRFDPLPLHTDEDAAAASRVGGLIASGFRATAVLQRLMVGQQANVVGTVASQSWRGKGTLSRTLGRPRLPPSPAPTHKPQSRPVPDPAAPASRTAG
ncbi:hypothetical protein ADK36_00245 [Streptomyces viridochromogenes]|nr:hypothetical protein ADK36_00245 [Streptomyces viridochromogenes]